METATGDGRAERAAHNQSLFREVNERLEGLAKAFELIAGFGSSFTCECANLDCIEQFSMTVVEYEALRSHANRFAVLPGHVLPDVEYVVSEHDEYVVVEKIGPAGEIARAVDPRDGESE